MPSKHLDLGCGGRPRNTYQCAETYGVDISPPPGMSNIVAANLALEPIPFGNDEFDSVSAYDFLEHVPRVLPTADFRSTRLPFVELMNEVWRVLKPGGLFYASTPVYPHRSAFQDPTHVNFLTVDSHIYFTRPHRVAAMYGFTAEFAQRRVQLARPTAETLYIVKPATWWARFKLEHHIRRGHCSHVIWEFEALK